MSDMRDYASEILSANVNWAERLNQTFPQYFPDPKEKQRPKILWLGCSDSRVQESDATTALPGDVFVHRNIANQFHIHDDNALSVLAYGLAVLGIQHVVVVGHEHCGGVLTAMKEALRPVDGDSQVKRHLTLQDSLYHTVDPIHQGHHLEEVYEEDSKGPMDALTRWLMPLVEHLRKFPLPDGEEAALRVAVKENVKWQVNNLAQLEPFVRSSAKNKPVWVHGWVYDFSTGFLRDLHVTKELGAAKED